MILVYGDDSSDEKAERVCSVAGVVGTIPAWRLLEREWLVRTDGIPFHAKDCDSDQKDYRNFTHQENKQLYRDMATMLASSHICGWGYAADLMAMRRVFPQGQDISYYRGFVRVIQKMKDCAKAHSEIAEFTFDMRMESEHNAGLLYESIKESETEWAPYLAEKISFEFSRKNPRLQVADLLAHEAMKALDNQVGPVKRNPRGSWTALHSTGRFEVEAYSDDWFRDMKAHYAELEKRAGFCQQDYVNWLNQKRRQHNTTNLIHFMNWFDKQ